MQAWPLLLVLVLAACGNGAPHKEAANAATAAPRQSAPDGRRIVLAIKQALGAQTDVSSDARFVTAFADLNGDGRDEALVYLIDRDSCGSGGCNLFILTESKTAGWSVDSRLTIARLPIYELASRTAGWADLGVTVGGGGLTRTVMKVRRSGRTYASNPTVPPATVIDPGNARVLLSEESAGAPGRS